MSWFERNQFGSPSPGTLYSAWTRHREHMQDPAQHRRFAGPGEWVMGTMIPDFQREVVWTEDQMVRFIDSARRCIPLGTYTINLTFGMAAAKRVDPEGRDWYFGDLYLLDGQQRMTALERFFEDDLRVHGCLWSEIGQDEQRHFLHTAKFSYYETKFVEDRQMREYYDLMNFSGTPHRPEERASLAIR